MKYDMKQLKALYESDTGTNEMWEIFRDSLPAGIDAHVPNRLSKPKDSYT